MNGRWQMLASRDAVVTTGTRPARFEPVVRRITSIANATKSLLVRWVPNRFHAITDELAKFGTIGLINLGVNFGVFNLLLLLAIMQGSEVKAKAVATIVATTCAYFLNRHWTYRLRPKTTLRREYTLFFFFNAVGLVIETAFVGFAKYGLHETNLIVLNLFGFFGIAIGTVFRFWAYRTHVFKPAEPEGLSVFAGENRAGSDFKPGVEDMALEPIKATAVAPISPAIPATRVFVPQSLAISHHRPGFDNELPEDEKLHQEMVQLELAELVDDEADRASRH